MTPEEPQLWIVVNHWERFQHYKNRVPTWIKIYTELLDDPNYTRLSTAERSLLLGLWITYAKSRRSVPLDTRYLSRTCHQRVTKQQLESLNHAGFIHFSASKPLASRALAREEEKKEHAKDTQGQDLALSPKAFSVARENEPFDFAKINYLPKEMP